MNNTPLVSVIITTYKRSDFLQKCIQSVIDQSYPRTEILVVDDNGKDSEYCQYVKSICESFGSEKIIYLPMDTNSGACKARNYGFKHSKGQYVDFLDDDDYFEPDKIELQVSKALESNETYGMIGCYTQIVNKEGISMQLEKNNLLYSDAFFSHLCKSIWQTSVPIIKRELVEECGGFEDIVSSQEHLFFAKILNLNNKCCIIPKPLVNVRHYDGERISTNKRKVEGTIDLANRLKRYYSKLSQEQICTLELYLNKNIITSYRYSGDRINALRYWFKRLTMKRCNYIYTFSLLASILLPNLINRLYIKIRYRN